MESLEECLERAPEDCDSDVPDGYHDLVFVDGPNVIVVTLSERLTAKRSPKRLFALLCKSSTDCFFSFLFECW